MTTTSALGRVLVCVTAWIGILTPAMFAFKSEHHRNVTREVLEEATLTRTINGHTLRFQRVAIDEIILNNINQDNGAIDVVSASRPADPSQTLPTISIPRTWMPHRRGYAIVSTTP
jgi:hypothetical protein